MTSLVLIPGLGSDGAVWNRTVAALKTEVATQIGDTLQDGSLEGMARRILSKAPPRFVLAGVSMGGMVAMEMMRIAPERVSGLALVDTNARPDTEEQKARRQAANRAMLGARNIRELGGASLDYMLHPSASQSVREELTEMTERVGAAAYVWQNIAVAARQDLRPVLKTICVPTVVVVGEADRMTPPELSREIRELIPTAELHVLSQCGHLPPIEQPEPTAILLDALIRRVE